MRGTGTDSKEVSSNQSCGANPFLRLKSGSRASVERTSVMRTRGLLRTTRVATDEAEPEGLATTTLYEPCMDAVALERTRDGPDSPGSNASLKNHE